MPALKPATIGQKFLTDCGQNRPLTTIESITTLDMKDVPKDVDYYSLIPLAQGGKIYVRVDSSQDNMRPVISKDEAERLIKQIDEIEAIKITD